ncbi:hypothetical protein OESDEN_08476 [Oesophagostomum dentatum]|uniref:Uncharacterized protein n=1 Tax=Oesophagostomum dentatum TaxID=61180 RepID=A0A0B1T7B3_OESDE|nr:hypothetical protein OESDEN_08476 [Oesophagostomum dentatum]
MSKTTGAKVITKMGAAKKLLNKKVKLNVRKVFDDEGEVAKVDGIVEDVEETAGLDLTSAVESMKQSSLIRGLRLREDYVCAAQHCVFCRGEEDLDLGEGGSGIDSDADLSFLPDPDEVRKRYAEEYEGEKEVPSEGGDAPPVRKRRKHRDELKNTEQQALALLNPF